MNQQDSRMISKYSTALLVLIFVTLGAIHTTTAKRMQACRTRMGISRIDMPGCSTKKVASKGCDGHCMSSAVPRASGFGDFVKTCSCCSPTQSVMKYVTLQCANGKKKVIALPVAVKCKCRPC